MGKRRLSELMDQEIINVHNGEKYGYLGDCELIFDNTTGEILALLISESKSSLFSFKSGETIEVPWDTKFRLGDKTILFDFKTR